MSKTSKKDTCDVLCFNKDVVSSVKKQLPDESKLDLVVDMYSILGNKTRIKIIFALLRERELCVCDMANIIELTISATSHQLRKLRDKKIVICRNEGNIVYYSINDENVKKTLSEAFINFK
jgi:ArsR family transcriptional regulator